jgi:hypothetical protein
MRQHIYLYLFIFLLALWSPARAQQGQSDVGNFYPVLREHASQQNSQLSYLKKGSKSEKKWRKEARAKLQELLSYNPTPAPLNSKVLSTTKRNGYTQYLVRYNINAQQQTEAFLLIPDNLTKPAPAVIALHDHGGFTFLGRKNTA